MKKKRIWKKTWDELTTKHVDRNALCSAVVIKWRECEKKSLDIKSKGNINTEIVRHVSKESITENIIKRKENQRGEWIKGKEIKEKKQNISWKYFVRV